MENSIPEQKTRVWIKIGVVMLFLVFGTLIMVVFSPWRPLMKPGADLLGRVGLITLLGVGTWQAKKSRVFHQLWPMLSAIP